MEAYSSKGLNRGEVAKSRIYSMHILRRSLESKEKLSNKRKDKAECYYTFFTPAEYFNEKNSTSIQ